MARVQKAICDECNKEIDLDEWFYSGNLVKHCANYDIGEQLLNGDFCSECFIVRMKKRLNLKG